ncbi:MAG: WD40 repeat domain-containing protein [Candidatus Omnitrophota bacterium]
MVKITPVIKLKTAYEIIFSPDDDNFAFISDRNVGIMSVSSQKLLFKTPAVIHPGNIDFSPDGQCLVVKSTSGGIKILNAQDGSVQKDFMNQKEGEGSRAYFSKCGCCVVTVSWSGLLSVRDRYTTETIYRESSQGCIFNNLSTPLDRSFFVYSLGSRPVSGSEPPPKDKVILRRWPFTLDTNNYFELPQQWPFIVDLKVSPSGRFLGVIYGAPPRTIEIFDLKKLEVIMRQNAVFGGTGYSLDWSNDEKLIAVNCNNQVQIFNFPDLSLQHQIPIKYPCFVGFSTSSKFISLGSWCQSFIVPIKYLNEFKLKI